MAFTETTLATSSLMETTFISDMRLIVNANTTIVKSKIEDIINTLQIDLVNKYIGVDIPIQQLYTNDAVISNQLLFKSGTSGTSGTIASLTQTAGTSAFLADNINFTRTLTSLAVGSKVLTPAVVIGTTVGNAAVSFPTSGGSGVVDRGLHVGDATTPISASFYGEVNIKKQAVVQSYNTDFDTVGTVRTLELTSVDVTPVSTSGLYANLTLSKTDPQFIYVNLKTPAAFTLAATNSIYLLLHEDFTTTTSRPVAGQTFTIILNNLINNSNVEISTSTWPQAQVASGTAAAINIISGFTQTASAGASALKSGYINGALWPTLPTTVTSAITKLTETSPFLQYVRLYNRNVQAAAIPKPRATSVSFTKTQQSTNFSYYTVTNSHNIAIIN
jgi:hypothetical protein